MKFEVVLELKVFLSGVLKPSSGSFLMASEEKGSCRLAAPADLAISPGVVGLRHLLFWPFPVVVHIET